MCLNHPQTIPLNRPRFVEKSSSMKLVLVAKKRLGTTTLGCSYFKKTMLKILMENRQAEHTPRHLAVRQSLVFAVFYSSRISALNVGYIPLH